AGNYIGTDATGTKAVPNAADGVLLGGNSGAVIGGSVAGTGNVISGNNGNGIAVSNGGSYLIQGNRIGTQADGKKPLPNQAFGVTFQNGAGNDTLGGSSSQARNTIAFNGKAGVQVG